MLSILKYFNKKHIDSTYIILYSLSILGLIYLFGIGNISFFMVTDIYIFIYLSFFIFNGKFARLKPVVKIDITKEGVEKEEINMESLVRDYSKKFSSK